MNIFKKPFSQPFHTFNLNVYTQELTWGKSILINHIKLIIVVGMTADYFLHKFSVTENVFYGRYWCNFNTHHELTTLCKYKSRKMEDKI